MTYMRGEPDSLFAQLCAAPHSRRLGVLPVMTLRLSSLILECNLFGYRKDWAGWASSAPCTRLWPSPVAPEPPQSALRPVVSPFQLDACPSLQMNSPTVAPSTADADLQVSSEPTAWCPACAFVFASLRAMMFAALWNALSVHCVQAHVNLAYAAARDPRLLGAVSPGIVASRSQTLPASWNGSGEHHTSVPCDVTSLQLCNEVIYATNSSNTDCF